MPGDATGTCPTRWRAASPAAPRCGRRGSRRRASSVRRGSTLTIDMPATTTPSASRVSRSGSPLTSVPSTERRMPRIDGATRNRSSGIAHTGTVSCAGRSEAARDDARSRRSSRRARRDRRGSRRRRTARRARARARRARARRSDPSRRACAAVDGAELLGLALLRRGRRARAARARRGWRRCGRCSRARRGCRHRCSRCR